MLSSYYTILSLTMYAFNYLPQNQDDRDRIPLWIWLAVIFLVIVIGVIWTLREEAEKEKAQNRPDTLPEPVEPEVATRGVLPDASVEVDSELNVETPDLDVDADVPDVDVDAPKLDVDIPDVDIDAPKLAVETPDIDVDVVAPKLAVEAPDVDIDVPDIEVSIEKDDLTLLEGVEPPVEEIFNNNNIYTYEKLGATDPNDLSAMLSGSEWESVDTRNWREQSRLFSLGYGLDVAKGEVKPDDLKKVKGIGPKISAELNKRGITTFEQLSNIDVSYLEALMDELDWHINNPATWPSQATELAEAKRNK